MKRSSPRETGHKNKKRPWTGYGNENLQCDTNRNLYENTYSDTYISPQRSSKRGRMDDEAFNILVELRDSVSNLQSRMSNLESANRSSRSDHSRSQSHYSCSSSISVSREHSPTPSRHSDGDYSGNQPPQTSNELPEARQVSRGELNIPPSIEREQIPNLYTTSHETVVNKEPAPKDNLLLLYYPPVGTDVVFTTPTDPPLGTLYHNRHHYGQFYIVSTDPLAFKLMFVNQLQAYREFISLCSLTPPSSSDLQLVGTAHRQAVAAYGKKLRDTVGFFPDSSSHRFSFSAPMPLTEEIQQVFNTELKVKHSEKALRTLVYQSKADRVVSSLKAIKTKDTKIPASLASTQPDFGMNTEGGGEVLSYLAAPPLLSEDNLAATTAPGVHFTLPSAETRAAHLLARADTLDAVREVLAFKTIEEEVNIFRKDYKNILPKEASSDLQAVQASAYTHKHYAAKKVLSHARRTAQAHLLMRYEACHDQSNPSVLNSLSQGPLLSDHILHKDATDKVFADPQLQSLIKIRHSGLKSSALTSKGQEPSTSGGLRLKSSASSYRKNRDSFRPQNSKRVLASKQTNNSQQRQSSAGKWQNYTAPNKSWNNRQPIHGRQGQSSVKGRTELQGSRRPFSHGRSKQ